MFFSSIIGMNRLISKGMSNLYYWERLTFSKLLFCFATYKSEVWEQNNVCLFHYFNFEMNFDVLKSKSPRILLNKNMNFNKTKQKRKWKIPYTVFFTIRVFFKDTDDSRDSGGGEGTIFYFTLTHPPAPKHSDIYLELCMWDDYTYF